MSNSVWKNLKEPDPFYYERRNLLWLVPGIFVFGYATTYLSHNSTYLAYLNKGVYPFYIFHQTVLLISIFLFKDLFPSDLLFFLFLTSATLLGSWILFELVRRVNFLRPLFGMKGRFQRLNSSSLSNSIFYASKKMI